MRHTSHINTAVVGCLESIAGRQAYPRLKQQNRLVSYIKLVRAVALTMLRVLWI